MTGPSDEQRRRAFELYRVQGLTVAAAGKELGTSAASVIRWARGFEKVNPEQAALLLGQVSAPPAGGFMASVRARVEAAAAPPVEVADEVSSDDDAEEEFDDDISNESLLELVRGLIREARSTATTSDKREHVMRTIAGMLPVLDRIEKRMRDADDVLHVSKKEIDGAIKDIEENFTAVCDQPFLCAECGRKVRRVAAERAEAEGKGQDDGSDD